MSILRLIISALMSVGMVQVLWLLVAGFFGEKFIGPLAVLALPMTLVFFGVPAVIWTLPIIAATFYGLMAVGYRRFAPMILAVCGLAWIAYRINTPAPMAGGIPNYNQTLHFNAAAALVVWSVYGQWRLGFKSDSRRQVLGGNAEGERAATPEGD